MAVAVGRGKISSRIHSTTSNPALITFAIITTFTGMPRRSRRANTNVIAIARADDTARSSGRFVTGNRSRKIASRAALPASWLASTTIAHVVAASTSPRGAAGSGAGVRIAADFLGTGRGALRRGLAAAPAMLAPDEERHHDPHARETDVHQRERRRRQRERRADVHDAGRQQVTEPHEERV